MIHYIKYSVMQSATELCVILLTLLKGALSIDTKIVFTTQGSYVQLNTGQYEPSIYCEISAKLKEEKLSIANISGEYKTNKYQINSKMYKLNIRIPKVYGVINTKLNVTRSDSDLALADFMHNSDGMLYGKFTYYSVGVDYFTFERHQGSVEFYFEFILKIQSIIKFIPYVYGRCRCSLSFPFQIQLVISNLKFLKQTDDNIIYGQEGQVIELSCTTVTRQGVEELSIKQNGHVLAKSNSSIVTYSFTPDRHASFTKYRCVGNDPTWADVIAKLVINYAPDVNVVVREKSIDCLPNGFPKIYTFNKWEHKSPQGIHIRFLDGLHNGTLNLQSLSQKYQISGIYVCRVSNGISGANGILFQKGIGSFIYSGAPIFATENRKIKFAVPGEVFTMSFLIYSNPIVDKIWIGTAGSDLTKAERTRFGISKAALMYTASGENGNISGYEIVIETDIFRSIDILEYTIWAENKLGVDSYQFQILKDDISHQCYSEDSNQLIASGSIATVLLVYVFVNHVCFCQRMRKKRKMQSNIQEPFNNHAYDEIGPITNQEVNEHMSTTGHQELNQHVRILQYPQDESATTHISSQDPINDNTINTDISSRVSEQERSSNELQPVNPSEVTMHERSTVLHDVTTYDEGISRDDAASSTDQDGMPQSFRTGCDQDRNPLHSNRTSKRSTSIDESMVLH